MKTQTRTKSNKVEILMKEFKLFLDIRSVHIRICHTYLCYSGGFKGCSGGNIASPLELSI